MEGHDRSSSLREGNVARILVRLEYLTESRRKICFKFIRSKVDYFPLLSRSLGIATRTIHSVLIKVAQFIQLRSTNR